MRYKKGSDPTQSYDKSPYTDSNFEITHKHIFFWAFVSNLQ